MRRAAAIQAQATGTGRSQPHCEKILRRKGDVFLHCAGCGCVFVAIFEPTNKELVGVRCPECKYAWPLGSARQ